MHTRILTSSCLMFLMSGGVLGADKEQACMNLLAKTEALLDQRVEAKALSEDAIDEVNMLLDEADANCIDRKYGKAEKSIAKAKKMLVPPAQ